MTHKQLVEFFRANPAIKKNHIAQEIGMNVFTFSNKASLIHSASFTEKELIDVEHALKRLQKNIGKLLEE